MRGGSSAPTPVVVIPPGIIVNAASVLDVCPLLLDISEIPLNTPVDGNVNALTGLLTE